MTKKKHITVKQIDIDAGERGDHAMCPIASAVYRAWKGRRRFVPIPVHVRYDEGVIVGGLNDRWLWVAPLPPVAKRFITAFDKGRTVKPIAFDLRFK